MCVKERERERERDIQTSRQTEKYLSLYIYIYIYSLKEARKATTLNTDIRVNTRSKDSAIEANERFRTFNTFLGDMTKWSNGQKGANLPAGAVPGSNSENVGYSIFIDATV